MNKHPLTGRKQSPEHIAKRVASIRKTKETWTENRHRLFCERTSVASKGRISWLKGKKGKDYPDYLRKTNSECHKGIQVGQKHPMFGKHHTDESRLKNSLAHQGVKQSPELIKKRIDARAGYKHSLETKVKIGKANAREDNGNWLGGIGCEPYASIWIDKRFKAGIRERDNHECQNPDCRGNCDVLAIHHIDYDKKNCEPENLITLCRSCNGRANFNRNFWEAGYKEIIRMKYQADEQQIVI